MLKNKVISADEAIALISDDDVVCTTGFVQSCIPEMLHAALEKRYVETQGPKGLTLIMCAGAGDSKGLGTGRLHHEGLLKRVIAANFGRMPKVAQAAQDNKIQGYNLPQGIISKLYRSCASGQPGLFSKVGLHTYVDPRLGGGKVNAVTTEDIVKLVEVDGREWLFYKATPIDVALIRATSADPFGNLSMEKEALTLDCLAQAMGAHNNGGIVIAQVERIVAHGSLKPKDVRVPGILVDCVVVADPPEMHRMNYGVQYNPALSGAIRVPVDHIPKMELDERKIIARRAAFELPLERRHQSRRRRAGRRRIRCRGRKGDAVPHHDHGSRRHRRRAGRRLELRRLGECPFGHRPEPDVRFLPRRRLGSDLPRHGRGRRARQRQHEQVRRHVSTAAAASSTSRRTRARWCSPARSRPAASMSRSRTAS